MAAIEGIVLVAETVAGGFVAARAVVAHVGGHRLQREGAHHHGSSDATPAHRVITALGGAGRGRLVTVVVGAIAGGPGRAAEGGAIGEVDGARHGLLRFVGQVLSISDLLDGRVADAGAPVGGGRVLQVGEVDVLALGTGSFVGRDDFVDIPAVVVTRAARVGPVLHGVAVAAKLVE